MMKTKEEINKYNLNKYYNLSPERKESRKRKAEIWLENNKDYVNERKKKYRLEKESFEQKLFYRTKNRAKKLNKTFNIELKDIIIPKMCPYLNVPLTQIKGRGKTDFNPSIDRIDNEVGYVKGNIRIISNLANSMKRDDSNDLLIDFAKGVFRLHKYGDEWMG